VYDTLNTLRKMRDNRNDQGIAHNGLFRKNAVAHCAATFSMAERSSPNDLLIFDQGERYCGISDIGG
jgi:hypothetical protein